MHLAVSPEHLQAISAQLGIEQESLAALVATQLPAAAPGPAAIDPVSTRMSAEFSQYTVTWAHGTADGLSKLLHGAEVLVPVSIDYTTTDTGGGATLAVRGSVFPV